MRQWQQPLPYLSSNAEHCKYTAMKARFRHTAIASAILACMAVASCSTVKVLSEDQRRLTSTKIEVTNDKKFNSSNLIPYMKQKASNWNPFLYVYNWENGKGKGWDWFVHKLGTPPVIYDSTMVESSITNISDHLRYIGYYGSTVTAEIDSSRVKKARVKYLVNLGKRYKIRKISYDVPGYNVEFYKDFYADTSKCLIRKGDYLSEEALDLESARGAAVLHDKGFYDFSKNYYFFEADTVSHPGYADLDIIVRSHTRNEASGIVRHMEKYRLGRISVSYPEDVKFREKALRNLNMLHSGDIYSDRNINTQYSRYNSVNYFNSVNMALEKRENEKLVDCDIQLKKGKTQGFKLGLEASINTNGLWGISPELSYYHRNIFHGGEVLNISLNTNHQIKNGNSNVRSNEVNVSASLIFPKFFPFPTRWFNGPDIPKTEVNFTYNYQNRPEYIRNIASASFGYVGRLKKFFHYQAYPVSFNYVRLPFIDPTFMETLEYTNLALVNSFMNHLDLGISATFYYNTSTSVTNPKDSYWFTRFKLDLSGNTFSLFNPILREEYGIHYISDVPYSQYVRGEWEIGKTFVFGRKQAHSLAGRFLVGLGYGYGNSYALPFEKRFYSGGANSLRGWVARTLGPGTSQNVNQWVIPNQTGDMRLEANLEYRFKIFWRFSGAAFVDAGNIWEVRNPGDLDEFEDTVFSFANLGESLAASWGVGLRLDLTYLLLRIDYGMRFHDPARDPGNRWVGPKDWFKSNNHAFHFGVGYPF